ncbi:hypothetical protein [Eikenella corrodens]|uniref:hypothetical protein n=1 Tax=Eikenella corrodens TaxID=539 RepID=UPI000B147F86|nr:hypothetical protein [Eikenella corrodens]
MSNIYPKKLVIKAPMELKLGIKSSLPKIHTAFSLLYFLWVSNDKPYALNYSKEIANEREIKLQIDDDVLANLLRYLDSYLKKENTSKVKLLENIESNPLLSSQIEALIVAFELVWKFAKISFVDDKLSFSSERTKVENRSVRYNKRLEFTNLVDIIDSLVQTNKLKYESMLLDWLMGSEPTNDSNPLIKLITILADESIYKIQLSNDEITFVMGGLYQNLVENGVVSIKSNNESKGSLRILGNILDSNLNYFLERKNGNVVQSNNISSKELGNYAKRSLLRFDLQNINLRELEPSDSKTLSNDSIVPPLASNNSSRISLPKPFLILAGISGTGKSRYIRKQAQMTGGGFALVAVRPDWHEPSDLLGYISRLSGRAEYVVSPVLKFIVQAWQAIVNAGLLLVNDGLYTAVNLPSCLNVPPYWLCLDEMNLAPVEQYFADYLAVLETREFIGAQYRCLPLLSAQILQQLDDKAQASMVKDLGLENHVNLWQHFKQFGIALPFNLLVAGTVNMDETTCGFSRKVIDRAVTWDFGAFFPNDFKQYFGGQAQSIALNYPLISSVDREHMNQVPADPNGSASIAFLERVKEVLAGSPFEPAFRALNELMLSVYLCQPQDQVQLQAVWDDFLMTKILPRIEGDMDKLSDDKGNNLLNRLETILQEQLSDIWTDGKQRKDFLRISQSGNTLQIQCRSKVKLEQMNNRLIAQNFCHFWP